MYLINKYDNGVRFLYCGGKFLGTTRLGGGSICTKDRPLSSCEPIDNNRPKGPDVCSYCGYSGHKTVDCKLRICQKEEPLSTFVCRKDPYTNRLEVRKV